MEMERTVPATCCRLGDCSAPVLDNTSSAAAFLPAVDRSCVRTVISIFQSCRASSRTWTHAECPARNNFFSRAAFLHF